MFRLEKFLLSLSNKFNWIAAAAIVGMMLLTTMDVILRFFRMPVPGTYEIVGLLGAVAISFSLAYTSIEKGHIAVEFLVRKFSEKTQIIIDIINNFIASIFFGIVSWRSAFYAMELLRSGEVSSTLQMPTYPFVFGVAIGCGLLALVLMIETWKSFKGANAK